MKKVFVILFHIIVFVILFLIVKYIIIPSNDILFWNKLIGVCIAIITLYIQAIYDRLKDILEQLKKLGYFQSTTDGAIKAFMKEKDE